VKFPEVVRLIAASRERGFQAVNTELIDLYWHVGATISRKIKAAEWEMGSSNDSLPILRRRSLAYAVLPELNCFV
jgi:hypothetical protein